MFGGFQRRASLAPRPFALLFDACSARFDRGSIRDRTARRGAARPSESPRFRGGCEVPPRATANPNTADVYDDPRHRSPMSRDTTHVSEGRSRPYVHPCASRSALAIASVTGIRRQPLIGLISRINRSRRGPFGCRDAEARSGRSPETAARSTPSRLRSATGAHARRASVGFSRARRCRSSR